MTIISIKLDASGLATVALPFKWVQNSQPPRVAEVGRLSQRAKMHFPIMDEKVVFVCTCTVATINFYKFGQNEAYRPLKLDN